MTDDPIPGFTPEQSWALRTVARETARETVAELAARPCPADCEDMREVKAAVFGNGTPGLKTRTTTLEEQVGNLVWWMRATIAAALSATGAAIVSLFR